MGADKSSKVLFFMRRRLLKEINHVDEIFLPSESLDEKTKNLNVSGSLKL